MNKKHHSCKKNEQGFTLVEVAIALLVIALLIGGVLKGQELIINSQINATVAQVEKIDAAIVTFRDSYQGYPGDLARANTRLPNCVGCRNGDGNTVLGPFTPPNWINWGANREDFAFWQHLNAVDLVGGVDGSLTVPVRGTGDWGRTFPAASVGGGFTVGHSPTGVIIGAISSGGAFFSGAGTVPVGHYLTLRNDPWLLAWGTLPDSTSLTSSVAARMDRKVDDGLPNSGAVRGLGNLACATSSLVNATYTEATYQEPNCALTFRMN